MSKPPRDVVFITGASSGVGAACVSLLVQEGYTVYGTYRSSIPSMASEINDNSNRLGSMTMMHMNVKDEISVQQGIQCVLEVEKRIDVVINSAGYALAGSLEETTVEEAKQLFETNFWGIHRVCRVVLPTMREQRSGLIINISSIAGIVSLPFQSFYCAGKFALEALTDALRMEVRQFGINVVLVDPGDLATQFTVNRHLAKATQSDSAYNENFSKALKIIEHEETHGYAPDHVARIVAKIIKHPSPKPRYFVGSPLQKSSALLKKILPANLFEWIIMKFYNVN